MDGFRGSTAVLVLILAAGLGACDRGPTPTVPVSTRAVMAPSTMPLATKTPVPTSTSTPEPTPTPTPTPTSTPAPTETTSPARAILESAFAAQGEVGSYHFDIEMETVVTAADSAMEILLTFAGDRQRPDRMQGIVTMESEDSKAETEILIVGGDGYQSHPVTGRWQPIDGPVFLFSPEDVLRLESDRFQDLQIVGDEIIEDRTVHHLRGTLPTSALVSLGDAMTGELRADFWIDVTDYAIRRVTLEGEVSGLYVSDDSTSMVATVDFTNYGQTVVIDLAKMENADAPTPAGGCLVLSSDRDGDRDLYAVNMAGAYEDDGEDALLRVTDLPGEEHGASWSPDGKHIVFWAEQTGNRDIFVVNARDALRGAAEEALTRLTEHPGLDTDPAWSPDGGRVAFASDRDGNEEVYILELEAKPPSAGTGTLTRVTDNPARDTAPAWSPDGTLIAFESDRAGNVDIYVASPDDGGTAKPLTHDSANDHRAVWSPDGRYIAYQSGREWHEDIHVVDIGVALENPNEDAVIQLTKDGGGNRLPAWSPDSAWLAYSAEGRAIPEIRAINLEDVLEDPVGAQVYVLARGVLYVQSPPAWSPGGTHLAVVAMLGLQAVRSLQVISVEPALEGAGRVQPVALTPVTSLWMTPVELSWSPESCSD